MSRTERKFEGVQVYGSYESPFIRTGIPIIASRRTENLKPEFYSWFINYAKDNACGLSPANLAFINERFQQKMEKVERGREKDKKSVRFSLIFVGVILLLGIVLGSSSVSLETALKVTSIILIPAIPIVLIMFLPQLVRSKIHHDKLSDEVDVVTDALLRGQYTAYSLTVTQKKWSESSYTEVNRKGKSYTSYRYYFYVDLDELTLEVDGGEYDNMQVGSDAIVVIFHTTAGEAMCLFASRG